MAAYWASVVVFPGALPESQEGCVLGTGTKLLTIPDRAHGFCSIRPKKALAESECKEARV